MTPESDSLSNQTALITGGAQRIGKAVTQALAEAGAGVIIHYNRSGGDAENLAADIRGNGGQAWTVGGDLSDPDAPPKIFADAVDKAGPVSILINNASIFPESRLTEFTPEELQQNINVNALAPLLLSRAFADQGLPGNIVNFLDTRVVSYDAEHAAYHVSKRMLHTLTRMMALEFAPRIRVNAIAPGVILPPEGKDENYLEKLAKTNPLCAVGTLADITGSVLFLIRTGFITGQIIYVDGGRHMRGATYG